MKTETYRYSAIDESGKQVSGSEAATSPSAAHLALLQRGYQPLEIKQKKSILKFEITKKKVPRKELMHFSRQLSVFVEAGIPIMEALEVISEEASNKLFKSVILDMIGQLQAGDTFASAAAAHPEAFPRYYVAVLESAELTGTLDVVLRELAEYIERDVDARSKLISALIYPAVVFVLAIVVVVVLCTFVLPKFKTFFTSLNAKLPLPTRMLLAFSNFISHWWWLILALILLAVVGVIALRRSRQGRAWMDSMILQIPVAGGVVQAAIVERVCRVLQSLVT
ncbi:MAG TPA: type II secretion system F family protein, partial [Acidimicrobiales bacterium]